MHMNKTDDNELLKKALMVGSKYIRARGFGEIESHDSQKLKVEFIYKALVQDKLIQPLAKDKISDPAMRKKLILWISRTLPVKK